MKANKVSNHNVASNSYLEQYKQVYAMYNHATRLIKEDNLDSAELILQEIFNDHDSLQIPIEIYKTYILLLLTNKKEKQARIFLSNAPDEIKYAGEILQIQQKYNLTLIEKVATKHRTKPLKMIYGLVSTLFISFLAIGVMKFDLFNRPSQSSQNVEELKEQIKNLEDKNKSMEVQVNEVTKKLTASEKKKKEENSTKNTNEKQQSRFSNENSLKPTKVVNQAVEAYEKGFELFKRKNYKESVEQFKVSYTLDSTNYSSDDALYYLILAEQRINKKTNVRPYITEFVNQKTEFFKESPYYDDVLLMHARWLITDHKQKEAEVVLNDILSNYKKEWTANTASRLLQQIKK